jgi:hypothetical protein
MRCFAVMKKNRHPHERSRSSRKSKSSKPAPPPDHPVEKLSKNRQLRQEMLGWIRRIGIEQVERMIGMASKYILPPSTWDHTEPIELQSVFDWDFSTVPVVKNVGEGFTEITSAQLRVKDEITTVLRDMARFDSVLQRSDDQPRLRKKRLSRYRHEMRRVLKQADQGSERGLILVLGSIRRQFLD